MAEPLTNREGYTLVATGQRPCLTCGKTHNCWHENGSNFYGSWGDPEDGHAYKPISELSWLSGERVRLAAECVRLTDAHAEAETYARDGWEEARKQAGEVARYRTTLGREITKRYRAYGTLLTQAEVDALVEVALAKVDRAALAGGNTLGVENYTGPDDSVECAHPRCANRLRRAAFNVPQFCSKEHRSAAGGNTP